MPRLAACELLLLLDRRSDASATAVRPIIAPAQRGGARSGARARRRHESAAREGALARGATCAVGPQLAADMRLLFARGQWRFGDNRRTYDRVSSWGGACSSVKARRGHGAVARWRMGMRRSNVPARWAARQPRSHMAANGCCCLIGGSGALVTVVARTRPRLRVGDARGMPRLAVCLRRLLSRPQRRSGEANCICVRACSGGDACQSAL